MLFFVADIVLAFPFFLCGFLSLWCIGLCCLVALKALLRLSGQGSNWLANPDSGDDR